MKENVKKTVEALTNNGFDTHYFASGQEAVDWVLGVIQSGQKVSFGGSVTLTQLDLRRKMEEKGVDYLDYRKEGSPQEQKEWMRQCFFTDAYFSSANAITEDGFIFNVDGRGNRLAAITFGPDHVFIIAGQNKICSNLAAAEKRRADIAAPLNCKRLSCKTPCVETGQCVECNARGRVCRAYLVLKRPLLGTKMTVIIVGEELGY